MGGDPGVRLRLERLPLAQSPFAFSRAFSIAMSARTNSFHGVEGFSRHRPIPKSTAQPR